MATADTEQQLAWERRQRPRAGIAAVLGGVLSLVADIWMTGVLRDVPKAGFLEALLKAVEPGPITATESLRTPYYRYIESHAGELLLANAAKAIGLLGIAWALTYLAAATRARRPQLARPVMYLAIVGAVLSAIAGLAYWLGYVGDARTFLSGPHTVERAADVGRSSGLVTAQFINLAGQLALAAAFVLIGLNAMRAGLLTRFMGILAVIIGVLQVVPLGPLPVVQAFWLVGFGVLCFNAWPSGMPRAWASGQAEPWPSKAEISEQRRAAVEARRAAAGRGKEGSEPAMPASGGSEPAKRKRKRRS